MTVTEFALYVLATFRLTQLVGWDRVTGRIRWRWFRWRYRRAGFAVDDTETFGDTIAKPATWDMLVDADAADGTAPRGTYMLRCWWCLSVWSAGVLLAVHELWPTVWLAAVSVAAASTLAVFIRRAVDEMS